MIGFDKVILLLIFLVKNILTNDMEDYSNNSSNNIVIKRKREIFNKIVNELNSHTSTYFNNFSPYTNSESQNSSYDGTGSSRLRRNRMEQKRKIWNHRRRRKECPTARKGQHMMLCPSRNERNYDICISAEQLCDNVENCPEGEDEDLKSCMFYKATKHQLKHIYNALLLLTESTVGDSDKKEL
ncbi:GH16255p [Strongyloides ratti]|uniref:GH16255p n=1 Tax=Strongyloides ratti TaxID=34506 RepID=A0A090L9K8_STRRB|nr:GH16255p [Strongyloides ratti]CEF64808.1 GH16255p [Strongyloides ratti]